jgi:hypothetical protein
MTPTDWILIFGFSFLISSISLLLANLSKKLDAIYNLQFDANVLSRHPNIDKGQLKYGWAYDAHINP